MRGLSEIFIGALKNPDGILNPILNRVHKDYTLDMQIRDETVTVYYRGGKLLLLKPDSTKCSAYFATFDEKYLRDEFKDPGPQVIASIAEAQVRVKAFAELKNAMDLWFAAESNWEESAFLQTLVYDNNRGSAAKGTDYFIIDTQYPIKEGGVADALALRWHSDAKSKRLQRSYKPRLRVIEMKYGDGAIKNESGLKEHMDKCANLLTAENVVDVKEDAVTLVKQKNTLGLINPLNDLISNPAEKLSRDLLDEPVDVMLVLANHDPESRLLFDELTKVVKSNYPFEIFVVEANFMGYGLYEQRVLRIDDWMSKRQKEILDK